MKPTRPAAEKCPICQILLRASPCPGCKLAWRTPSARSKHVEAPAHAGAPPPGASPRAMAFRPRTGEVLATLGMLLLYTPVAAVLFSSVIDGSLWSGHIFGWEVLWWIILLCVLALAAMGGLRLFWHAVTLAGRLIAPPALRDDGEILEVRPGGFGRGRAWLRLAKLDLREVVLDPHAGGYLHDLLVAHRAGPALLLTTELPKEDAERLGTTLAGWLGKAGAQAGDYRKGGAR